MTEFIIAVTFFTLGIISVIFWLMVFCIVLLWKTVMGLSGNMTEAVASALEEGYNISQTQRLHTVSKN